MKNTKRDRGSPADTAYIALTAYIAHTALAATPITMLSLLSLLPECLNRGIYAYMFLYN